MPSSTFAATVTITTTTIDTATPATTTITATTAPTASANLTKLFEPLQMGSLTLPNRIIMAPLTRIRTVGNHVPSDLMVEHYRSRAAGGAGLLIAEATMILEGNSAFISEPGIVTAEQLAGWRRVVDAVHQAGGIIFLQIWHAGRAAHPLLNNGAQPVSASAIAIDGLVHTPQGKQAYVVPRELSDDELPTIVQAFKQAAQNAKSVGFDGVEVHAANGYLLDQFLRDGSNKRSGAYGGSVENRARLTLEVLEAVTSVWEEGRVGIRFAPLNSYNSMKDSDPVGLITYLAQQLNRFRLAYVHVIRSDLYQIQQGDILTPLRQHYSGVLISNGGYTAAEAESQIRDGLVDAVAWGALFISNPDLPLRFKLGAPLNKADSATYYVNSPQGYNDYPLLDTAVNRDLNPYTRSHLQLTTAV